MNEKVMRHKTICDELNSLYERKNHDYGDSFHQTFVEEGLAMTRIRLGDKFSRFKTLSRLSANDAGQQRVTDESIRDTLMDLANYAIMTILWVLHEQFGFGAQRLRTYYDAFHDRIKELVSRYEMEDQDDIWLCTQMLKRIGVDIEAWHKESDYGT